MNRQLQSPLLRIPLEIRQQIWQDVFSDPHLIIKFWDYSTKIFPYALCDDRRPLIPALKKHVCGNPTGCYRFITDVRYLKRVLNDRLGLALTCWMMYEEIIGLLYTNQTFHFPSGHFFTTIQRHLSPERFQQIRTLKLEFHFSPDSHSGLTAYPPGARLLNDSRWPILWYDIASMKGLRTLKVEMKFANPGFMAYLSSMRHLFVPAMHAIWDPLELVKDLEVFDVSIREFEGKNGFLGKLREWAGDKSVPYRVLAGSE